MWRLLAMFLCIGAACGYSISCDSTTTQQQAWAQKTKAALQAKGYKIEPGTYKFINASSFGANPSSTYGVYEANLGTTQLGIPLFFLGERDAVLWLGCTPPPLKYFSFRSYVFDTRKPFANVFASLGDSANNLVFNTTTASAMNSTAAVLSVADLQTQKDVSEALTSSGFPSSAINLDVVPSNILSMGRDPLTSDSLLMLSRVALFDNKELGAQYKAATWPIYFVRAPGSNPPPVNPLPVPPQRPRGTGHTEQFLSAALKELLSAVQTSVHTGKLKSTTQVKKIPIYGFNCIANHTECAGDNHDTTYAFSPVPVPLNSSVGWVVGVNHAAIGKATYSNFDINIVTKTGSTGVAAVSSEHFQGSAQVFLPDNPSAKYMFAYSFAYDCSHPAARGPHSNQASQFCLEISTSKAPPTEPVFVATRAYLEPPTKTGPLFSELLPEQVLVFETN